MLTVSIESNQGLLDSEVDICLTQCPGNLDKMSVIRAAKSMANNHRTINSLVAVCMRE